MKKFVLSASTLATVVMLYFAMYPREAQAWTMYKIEQVDCMYRGDVAAYGNRCAMGGDICVPNPCPSPTIEKEDW
jgi:hypothetical protein